MTELNAVHFVLDCLFVPRRDGVTMTLWRFIRRQLG